jgi:hydrogenase maturation protein HypF
MPSGSSAESVLACGSELKSTGAVLANGTVYCSQHIGDMSSTETNTAHTEAMARLVALYGAQDPVVAADMHPDFFARSREIYKASTAIQHHHAHMAACMVDNGLPDGTYLGVVLDGVGFGSDGQLWGSEFLVGGYRTVRRVSSLRGVPLIGGDAAVRNPVRIAFALGRLAGLEPDVLASVLKLSKQETFVFDRMLLRSINTVQASSMGRLFDGAAALAGLAHHSEYEAQGPVEFEGLLGRVHTLDNSYPVLRAAMDNDGLRVLDWSNVCIGLRHR